MDVGKLSSCKNNVFRLGQTPMSIEQKVGTLPVQLWRIKGKVEENRLSEDACAAEVIGRLVHYTPSDLNGFSGKYIFCPSVPVIVEIDVLELRPECVYHRNLHALAIKYFEQKGMLDVFLGMKKGPRRSYDTKTEDLVCGGYLSFDPTARVVVFHGVFRDHHSTQGVINYKKHNSPQEENKEQKQLKIILDIYFGHFRKLGEIDNLSAIVLHETDESSGQAYDSGKVNLSEVMNDILFF